MFFPDPLPVALSARALDDFVGLLQHTGQTRGRSQFLAHRKKIDRTLRVLSHNPAVGQQRADLPADHRAHVVGTYVIVYRTADDGLHVARLLHQRMSVAGGHTLREVAP